MSPDAIANLYASDIVSGFDIHKPEKLNELFRRYGDQGLSAFQLLRSMGFEKEVANDTFSHYEEKFIHEIIHSKENVDAPGQGEPITFTLSDQDVDSHGHYYVRKWDVIMFPNEVTGEVIDINVNDSTITVTCELQDINDEFPALTADEELIIITNAFAEGSGQPKGAISGAWEFENDCQIIKETIGYTGTEMVTQDWFDVTSDGQAIPAYYFKGQIDIDYRMALRIDGALMFSKRTNNPALVDSSDEGGGRAIKSTEGLVPMIRRLGNEQTYPAGAFDVDEFDTLSMTLDREFAGNYVLMLLGIRIHQDIENSLKDYFDNTNINYAKQATNEVLFHNNEALSASVNFTYLTKSERTFLMKRMQSFNNKKLYGAEGYNMPYMGVVVPINKKKDVRTGEMLDSIGVRYRALGRYNRRMEVWQVGGAGEGLKVNQFDSRNTYQRCHLGLHVRGANQMVILEGV